MFNDHLLLSNSHRLNNTLNLKRLPVSIPAGMRLRGGVFRGFAAGTDTQRQNHNKRSNEINHSSLKCPKPSASGKRWKTVLEL